MMPGSTNTVTSRTAKATVDNNVQIVAGSLKDESWRNKGGLDLETQNVGVPDTTSYLTNFETLADPWGGGAHRVTGFFTPTVSGNYVFFDASSDSSDLFLSTDDQPANLRLICQEPGWSASRTSTTDTSGPTSLQQKRSDTFVDPVTGTTPYAAGIPLVAVNRYFVYGACSRNFAVTFKVNPADPDPVNGDPPRFTSEMLSHVESGVVTKPTITTFVSGPTLRVSWAPAAGHLESSPVLPPVSWSNLGYANPAYLTINPSSNLFLRVVNP